MPTPECAELLLYADAGSFCSSLMKEYCEFVVDVDMEPLAVALVPKLPVLLCADSSLLAPLVERPGLSVKVGFCRRGCAFSCGVCAEPIGVARLSFGGPALGMESGGRPTLLAMGGAAPLLTGLWLGDAGMASPRRGTLLAEPCRPPGTGGCRSGTPEAIVAEVDELCVIGELPITEWALTLAVEEGVSRPLDSLFRAE